MKTVHVELDIETAHNLLENMESALKQKVQARVSLNEEISLLQQKAASLRSQLQNGKIPPVPANPVVKNNRTKIREYLSTIEGNKGARMTDIHTATGIGVSSVAFTLNNYNEEFECADKLWKLKR